MSKFTMRKARRQLIRKWMHLFKCDLDAFKRFIRDEEISIYTFELNLQHADK